MLINRHLLYIGFFATVSACSSLPNPISVPMEPARLESYQVVEDKWVSVSAVGDMMLGGTAAPYLEKEGYDYPFLATKATYQDSDLLIGNLETPLTYRGEQLVEKKYRFRNPPEKVAAALKGAGFDIVSLANNHTLDYGVIGLQDTFEALQREGIKHHGAGNDLAQARSPRVFTLENGQRVAFLAYSNTFPQEFWAKQSQPGTAFGHEHYVREDVSALKSLADIIIVSFHWGREGTTQLREYQPILARAAIDEGADLVLGHHPHILQAVEAYREGLILYSLGNYVFGSFSNRVFSSVIANITFKNGAFYRLDMTPININNFQTYFQPQILHLTEAENVYKELQEMSFLQGTVLEYKNEQIFYQTKQ